MFLSIFITSFTSEIGQPLPSVEVSRFNQESIAGKYTIIKFWQSTWPTCRKEEVPLKKFYFKYKDEFNLVYISVDKDPLVLKQHLIDTDLDKYLPIYYDQSRKSVAKFRLKSTPTSIVVDRNGIIIRKWSGYTDWDKVDIEDLKISREGEPRLTK